MIWWRYLFTRNTRITGIEGNNEKSTYGFTYEIDISGY